MPEFRADLSDRCSGATRWRRVWQTWPTYAKFTMWCGGLLFISGLAHMLVFIADGGGWAGPLSWRKPIVFGLSFGLTVLTLGWYMTLLTLRQMLGWTTALLLGLASIAEVGLITMQTWRGVASHFNDSSAFDATVFALMGLMVALVVVGILLLTWHAFRSPLPGTLSVAVRGGMLVLIFAQVIGAWMIAGGSNLHGSAGAIKVPHALGMHGLQFFPFVAWLLARADLDRRKRRSGMWLTLLGYLLLLLAAVVQAAIGRAVVDPAAYTVMLVLVALPMITFPVMSALRHPIRPPR